jgi:hypothetical protein
MVGAVTPRRFDISPIGIRPFSVSRRIISLSNVSRFVLSTGFAYFLFRKFYKSFIFIKLICQGQNILLINIYQFIFLFRIRKRLRVKGSIKGSSLRLTLALIR